MAQKDWPPKLNPSNPYSVDFLLCRFHLLNLGKSQNLKAGLIFTKKGGWVPIQTNIWKDNAKIRCQGVKSLGGRWRLRQNLN